MEKLSELIARKVSEVTVGATEHARALRTLARSGIRGTASPVRVGGLVVGYRIRIR